MLGIHASYGSRGLKLISFALQYLRHAVCSTITVDETFKGNPLHGNTSITESLLQRFTLSADSHDMAWGDGQEVIGVVHLIIHVYRDNFKTSVTQVLYEGQVFFP